MKYLLPLLWLLTTASVTADETECVPDARGNLYVGPEQHCLLEGVNIPGNVVVQGGELDAQFESSIDGNLVVLAGGRATFLDSQVYGRTLILGGGAGGRFSDFHGSVRAFGEGGFGLDFGSVYGDVTLRGGHLSGEYFFVEGDIRVSNCSGVRLLSSGAGGNMTAKGCDDVSFVDFGAADMRFYRNEQVRGTVMYGGSITAFFNESVSFSSGSLSKVKLFRNGDTSIDDFLISGDLWLVPGQGRCTEENNTIEGNLRGGC